jgi:hypothetical protein
MSNTTSQPLTQCHPDEVALKSFFLGPQAENSDWLSAQMSEILERWFHWRRGLFPGDGNAISVRDRNLREFHAKRAELSKCLGHLMAAFEAEVPKFSPRYIGHMFSEIALPALFGHIIALLHNPNNISGESAPVGVKIEDEAIRALLTMLRMPPSQGMGHFTSGGTVANFEALVRARARTALWLAKTSASPGVPKCGLFEAAHLGWDEFERGPVMDSSALNAWDFTRSNPWAKAYRSWDWATKRSGPLSSTSADVFRSRASEPTSRGRRPSPAPSSWSCQ